MVANSRCKLNNVKKSAENALNFEVTRDQWVEVYRTTGSQEQFGFRLHKGFDLVTFKWFLNDWNDLCVEAMLTAARCALGTGKFIAIYEHLQTESIDQEMCLTKAYPGDAAFILSGFRQAFRTFLQFRDLLTKSGYEASHVKRHFICENGMTLILAKT